VKCISPDRQWLQQRQLPGASPDRSSYRKRGKDLKR
jgi:hypothetical protein